FFGPILSISITIIAANKSSSLSQHLIQSHHRCISSAPRYSNLHRRLSYRGRENFTGEFPPAKLLPHYRPTPAKLVSHHHQLGVRHPKSVAQINLQRSLPCSISKFYGVMISL
ncbi:hypothetical protein LINGRAHAP2_LOCUS5033, partial [Linum grandiflorum]